jgi:hypothetical protein
LGNLVVDNIYMRVASQYKFCVPKYNILSISARNTMCYVNVIAKRIRLSLYDCDTLYLMCDKYGIMYNPANKYRYIKILLNYN